MIQGVYFEMTTWVGYRVSGCTIYPVPTEAQHPPSNMTFEDGKPLDHWDKSIRLVLLRKNFTWAWASGDSIFPPWTAAFGGPACSLYAWTSFEAFARVAATSCHVSTGHVPSLSRTCNISPPVLYKVHLNIQTMNHKTFCTVYIDVFALRSSLSKSHLKWPERGTDRGSLVSFWGSLKGARLWWAITVSPGGFGH